MHQVHAVVILFYHIVVIILTIVWVIFYDRLFYVTDDGSGIPDGQLDDVLTLWYSTSEGETKFAIMIAKGVDNAHG